MVTTNSPTPSPPKNDLPLPDVQPGFFGQLVGSVFEPGANSAVVIAMNVSFFLLILTLFALAFLTGWNIHVLSLLGVTTVLWGSMAWFVLEITRVQRRSDNMPVADADTGRELDGALPAKDNISIDVEGKKER